MDGAGHPAEERYGDRGTRLPWLLLLAALLLASCGGSPTAGDPGNRRLSLLSADPVFASLPPGAELTAPVARTPARYRPPGFESGGWDGPAVTARFASAAPLASVYSFYADRAAAAGWTPLPHRTDTGYPDGWTKGFPGGWQGELSLVGLRGPAAGAGPTTYVLNASAPPAT